jgi:hypothetical protein
MVDGGKCLTSSDLVTLFMLINYPLEMLTAAYNVFPEDFFAMRLCILSNLVLQLNVQTTMQRVIYIVSKRISSQCLLYAFIKNHELGMPMVESVRCSLENVASLLQYFNLESLSDYNHTMTYGPGNTCIYHIGGLKSLFPSLPPSANPYAATREGIEDGRVPPEGTEYVLYTVQGGNDGVIIAALDIGYIKVADFLKAVPGCDARYGRLKWHVLYMLVLICREHGIPAIKLSMDSA